ncbi:MAG: hypothetical protein ACI4SF_02795 [Oscillospiraceae bacterium]
MNTVAYERILKLFRVFKNELTYEECIMLPARFEQHAIDKKKQELHNIVQNDSSPKPLITMTKCE